MSAKIDNSMGLNHSFHKFQPVEILVGLDPIAEKVITI